jgi:hypothetical protein
MHRLDANCRRGRRPPAGRRCAPAADRTARRSRARRRDRYRHPGRRVNRPPARPDAHTRVHPVSAAWRVPRTGRAASGPHRRAADHTYHHGHWSRHHTAPALCTGCRKITLRPGPAALDTPARRGLRSRARAGSAHGRTALPRETTGLDNPGRVERGCRRSRAAGQPDLPAASLPDHDRRARRVRAGGRRPGLPPAATASASARLFPSRSQAPSCPVTRARSPGIRLQPGTAIPITEVSRWLGHRSIETTHRIYGHIVPSSLGRARSVLDDAYEEICRRPDEASD